MFEQPLQFVVGKGGVGKSTFAAALATALAAQGRRVLAVSFGKDAGLARAFGLPDAGADDLVAIDEGLSFARVDGEAALAEYLSIVVPVGRLLSVVTESTLYRTFVAAAPGLRELMAMGKVCFEMDEGVARATRRWDHVVVDAGATGHSLEYLEMPAAAAETFSAGLVRREAERLVAVLRDPLRTAVHIVTTGEELPATEASTIAARLGEDLAMALGAVVLNRAVEPAPAGTAAFVEGGAERLGGGDRAVEVERAARRELLRGVVQEREVKRLEQSLGVEVLRLPDLVAQDSEPVASALAAALSAALALDSAGETP